MVSLEALAERWVMCSRCKAYPGAVCRTSSGRRSTRNHSARTWAVYEAWRAGFTEGLEDAADAAERLATANVDAKASAVVTVIRRRL